MENKLFKFEIYVADTTIDGLTDILAKFPKFACAMVPIHGLVNGKLQYGTLIVHMNYEPINSIQNEVRKVTNALYNAGFTSFDIHSSEVRQVI